MVTQARNYAAGNTDLSWTRLTPWRALLAAALDQYPARIKGGQVSAERSNPSADLLVAWLTNRLKVPIDRATSRGPGITSVRLVTGGGEMEISRPDGRLAHFSIPNAPSRPVALKRRELAELLAEELRRLDPDDTYAEAVSTLCRIADKDGVRRTQAAKKAANAPDPTPVVTGTDGTLLAGKETQRARRADAERSEAARTGRKGTARKAAARKRAGKKSTSRSSTRKSSASAAKKTARKTAKKS
jgi:hypothetical protein